MMHFRDALEIVLGSRELCEPLFGTSHRLEVPACDILQLFAHQSWTLAPVKAGAVQPGAWVRSQNAFRNWKKSCRPMLARYELLLQQ